jgi:hypothetical protein
MFWIRLSLIPCFCLLALQQCYHFQVHLFVYESLPCRPDESVTYPWNSFLSCAVSVLFHAFKGCQMISPFQVSLPKDSHISQLPPYFAYLTSLDCITPQSTNYKVSFADLFILTTNSMQTSVHYCMLIFVISMKIFYYIPYSVVLFYWCVHSIESVVHDMYNDNTKG